MSTSSPFPTSDTVGGTETADSTTDAPEIETRKTSRRKASIPVPIKEKENQSPPAKKAKKSVTVTPKSAPKPKGSTSTSKNKDELASASKTPVKGSGAKKRESSGGTVSKKRKLQELNDTIAELETSLKKRRTALKRFREKVNGEKVKLSAKLKAVKPTWELPPASAPLRVPPELQSDTLLVWDFLFSFKKQLHLAPLSLNDLIDVLSFQGHESVVLTEVCSAVVKLILTDMTMASDLMGTIPAGTGIFSRNKEGASKDECVVGDSYNGLRLLPRTLRADCVRPLTWQAILRSLMLRLAPFQEMAAYFCLGKKSATPLQEKLQPLLAQGEDAAAVREVLRRDAEMGYSCHPETYLDALVSAATALETQEFHQLCVREKVSVLRLLCTACYDVHAVRHLLKSNMEERQARMTEMEKTAREEAKGKLKDLTAERRAEVTKELTTKGKGKKPTPPELAAALDQAVVLDALGIDLVVPSVPAEVIAHPEAIKVRGSKRRYGLESIEQAEEAIINALASGEDKSIRTAVKLGKASGLRGELTDGTTYCTALMARALVAQDDLDRKARVAAEAREYDRALQEFFVRTEPLGTDSCGRCYWAFEGDSMLFVETVGKEDAGLPTVPARTHSSWAVYASDREIWKVLDKLGEAATETDLRSKVIARFELDQRPADFLMSGHAWIGRKVRREFGKGRNKRYLIGIVIGWHPAENDDHALWHVQHSDGDEEDLDEEEMTAALSDYDLDPNAGGADESDEPQVVASYINSSRGAGATREYQIGITGLRGELLQTATMLQGGLRARGSTFGKEEKKLWEMGVRAATTVTDLRDHLLAFEQVVREVQEVDDERDEEEDARLRAERRTEMLAEGWLLLEGSVVADDVGHVSANEFLGRRGRRFFQGHGYSNGTVVGYLPASSNEGLELWHIQHDDGDGEDLELHELNDALRDFDEDRREGGEESDSGSVTVSEDEVTVSDDGNGLNGDAEERLWPTAGVRERWQDAVRRSRTVAEVALALASLAEQSKKFGVVDETLDVNKSSRLFSSPKSKRRVSLGHSNHKVTTRTSGREETRRRK